VDIIEGFDARRGSSPSGFGRQQAEAFTSAKDKFDSS